MLGICVVTVYEADIRFVFLTHLGPVGLLPVRAEESPDFIGVQLELHVLFQDLGRQDQEGDREVDPRFLPGGILHRREAAADLFQPVYQVIPGIFGEGPGKFRDQEPRVGCGYTVDLFCLFRASGPWDILKLEDAGLEGVVAVGEVIDRHVGSGKDGCMPGIGRAGSPVGFSPQFTGTVGNLEKELG